MRLKSIPILLIALWVVFGLVSSEPDPKTHTRWKASLRKQALLDPRLLLHTSTSSSSHVLLHRRLLQADPERGRPGSDGPQGKAPWP